VPKRKGDTANKISDAARLEFAEFGYAGARMARIASRAGVNKQLLFYYFDSKDGLHRAVMETARNAVAAGFEAKGAPFHSAERLRAEIVRLFDSLAARPELVRLLLQEARQPDGTTQRILHEIRAIVSEGQGLGFFRDDMDPDLAARQALVLTLGYLGLESALGTNEAAARPAWRDATADLLIRAVSW
jgi:AcrR family transcriptional regulator